MRKFILWCLFILLTINVHSQDTLSTNIYQYNGNLGVGLNNPGYNLTISNNYSSGIERNLIHLNNTNDGSASYTGIMLSTGNGSFQSVIQDYGINYAASEPNYEFGGFLNLSNNSKGLMLHANSSDGIIKFFTGYDATMGAGVERMRIESDGQLVIGDSSPVEGAKVTVKNEYNSSGGGGFGIRVDHSTDNSYLELTSRSDIGYSSVWGSQAQGAALAGFLTLAKDNAGSYDSYSSAGAFVLEFDNYAPVGSDSYTHYLGGIRGKISGNISIYPEKSVISAVIGEDKILSSQSYAGYFIGKGYFSDSLGLGTKEPKAKLEVADGDIYISDIEKGIIMKSPDGQCWRGTLDNTGSLTFNQIDCPEVVTSNNSINESSVARNEHVNIFPNPANNYITIELKGLNPENMKYIIYDIAGRLILMSNLNSNLETINISPLQKGTYIVNLTDSNDNQISSRKFVKK